MRRVPDSLSRGPGRADGAVVVLLLAALAVLALPLGAAQGSSSEDRAPILLRRSPLLTPRVMLGSTLSPEVTVELRVDDRGRVTSVDTQSIAPSTEFDAVLRSDVAAQLERWRFAPAREAGEPVVAEVELKVQYRAFPESESVVTAEIAEEFFFGDPDRRVSEVLDLDFERRKVLIDRYAEVAERHLGEPRRRAESPRFVVISDARREETVEVLAANLEAVYRQFLETLEGALELQPERYKMVAYMFANRSALHATRLELRNGTVGEGFYVAPGFLAFHQQVIDPADVLAAMVHEAFHAFSDRLLRRVGRPPELWLEEGMAMYFSNSEIKKGRLVPGRTVHRKFLLHYGEVFKLRTQAGSSVKELRQLARSGELPTIGSLLDATRQEFYGERIGEYYGASWLLVHYLRHGEDGWADRQFPDLLLYLYEGYPALATLEEVYGVAIDQLEEGFREYVQGF